MLRLLFSRRWWWTTLIVIAGIGLAIRLGIWQLDRNTTRQASISHIQAAQAMPVLDLAQHPLPPDLETMEYRQVNARGSYDFDHQIALRNQVRSRMSGTDPGYALVTPLILPGGEAVLVERGWIPLDYNTPESWRQFDEPGTIHLTGILRLSLEKGELGRILVDPTLTPGQTRLDFWNFINLPRLQEQMPYAILKVYIQQAPGENLEDLPYRLMEAPNLDPGAHVGFAIQWFFYAGLLFFGYPIWLKKQKVKQ
jgi:surfeit locus 1 family protein